MKIKVESDETSEQLFQWGYFHFPIINCNFFDPLRIKRYKNHDEMR